jgi:hypothetical protein
MDRDAGPTSELVLTRVELSYCPRCGTLRVCPAGANADVCEVCVRVLQWLHATQRAPRRGRPSEKAKQ